MNSQNIFTPMEIDAIGEILNISLGSSATSVSGMLDKRVSITTPTVEIIKSGDFEFSSYEPAIGVEINYVSGLTGTNLMILKKSDVRVIVGLLLGTEFSEEDFELDEMSISAICEVMNQMMGASSTALSQFLNRMINISTPTSFTIENSEQFKRKYYNDNDTLVTVSFRLMIDGYINSEFISVFTVELAKELVGIFDVQEDDFADEDLSNQIAEEPVIEFVKHNEKEPAPIKTQKPINATNVAPEKKAAVQHQPPKQQAPSNYTVAAPRYDSFDFEEELSESQAKNLGLIMSVPLQITVEIGRTKKKIKDILELSQGSIVELNKQAGSQVDIFVNGKAIAKGDVVVIDDNYGVKITEVLSNSEILEIL